MPQVSPSSSRLSPRQLAVATIHAKHLTTVRQDTTGPVQTTAPAVRRGPQVRRDSWVNYRNRFGTHADPVISSHFHGNRTFINREEAEMLYQFDPWAARVVEQPARDATREWIEFSHESDPDKAEALRDEDERLNGRGHFEDGLRWGRLHGGALLVLGADDGGDPETDELDVEAVKEVEFLTVVDRWLAFPSSWERDPANPNFGRVMQYQVSRYTPIGAPVIRIHESRVIRFDGNPLSPLTLTRNWGWHASVLDRIYDALRNWGMSNQAAAATIPAFVTTSMQIENLKELIQSDQWNIIQARLSELAAQLAINNIAFHGQGEQLERLGTPISGLPELMEKFMEIFAGAAEIPKSILFQAESGALGGDAGENDTGHYYSRIAAMQKNYLKPRVRKWLDIIGAPLGIKPGEVDFTFNPLWQMTETQQAELYSKVIQADAAAVNAGLVDTPERLGVFRYGGGRFNPGMPFLDTTRQEQFLDKLDSEPVTLGPPEGQEQGGGEGGQGGGPQMQSAGNGSGEDDTNPFGERNQPPTNTESDEPTKETQGHKGPGTQPRAGQRVGDRRDRRPRVVRR